MRMTKPWRWTKARKGIRTLLEGGRTPDQVIKLMDDAYDGAYPDARASERAMTYSGHNIMVNEVAERLEKKS